MNYIFFILISSSIVIGHFNGTLDKVMFSLLDGCNLAVKTAFSLIGIMAFWLGIMRIAEKSGFIDLLSKVITPIIKPIFKDIKKDSNVLGDITMSLSANALGLTNAATPIGLRVMKKLQKESPQKDVATDNMCMFLAMNTAGFQVIPTTVIGILVGLGATNPFDIILPTLIVTTLSFIIAILTALIFKKIYSIKESIS